MEKRILIRLMTIGFISLFSMTEGYCQEIKQPLQLTIKSDKKVYEVGEAINIELILKNISKKEIIANDGWWPTLNINFKVNRDGKNLEQRKVVYKLGLPQKEQFKKIKPGEQISEDFNILDYVPIDKKGKYDIKVIYENQLNWYLNKDADGRLGGEKIFIDAYTGILTSNTITIKVIEKKGVSEGDRCSSDNDCLNINCSKYDTPIKEGYKPYCVNNKCKCMCYGCE